MQVLVVDDSRSHSQIIASVVRDAGHIPALYPSAERALAAFSPHEFDLAILDLELPGMNGFELVKALREKCGDIWIPMIILSAHSSEQNIEKGIMAGADDYLTKPINNVVVKSKLLAMSRIANMKRQLTNAYQKLEYISHQDGLTGLSNRGYFDITAEKFWQHNARQKTNVVAMMMDVDHFKLYNDHYGHPAGDECLKQVAEVIKQVIKRPADIVARYGGEEFICLLNDTPLAAAENLAQQLCDTLEERQIDHELSPTAKHLTLSIGVAGCADGANFNLNSLVACADNQLYKAKNQGRNRYFSMAIEQRKHVLIVDDDPDARVLMRQILEDFYQISEARNGKDCLNQAKFNSPDLILMDINMPDINGMEVCQQLKQGGSASTPVVFVSCLDKKSQLSTGKKVGGNAYITKPIDEYTLLHKVRAFL